MRGIRKGKAKKTVLNSAFESLPPVSAQKHPEDISKFTHLSLPKSVARFEKKDSFPLPKESDRAGLYHGKHYEYWLSGLSDYRKISFAAKKAGIKLDKSRILDFGCGSGRVLRHFSAQTKAEVWGCDTNERQVQWCNQLLSPDVRAFQNTTLPNLQIEDYYFDLVYAVSVFTHVDLFETAWLNELRRILRPGGTMYITIYDDKAWSAMPHDRGFGLALTQDPKFKPEWLKTGLPVEKYVFKAEKSQSLPFVFYQEAYIKHVWGKFFKVLAVIPQANGFQTALVLRKN